MQRDRHYAKNAKKTPEPLLPTEERSSCCIGAVKAFGGGGSSTVAPRYGACALQH